MDLPGAKYNVPDQTKNLRLKREIQPENIRLLKTSSFADFSFFTD